MSTNLLATVVVLVSGALSLLLCFAFDRAIQRRQERALDRAVDEERGHLGEDPVVIRIGIVPCCDMHNHHCEPPSDLCCERCVEAHHPDHNGRSRCVLEIDGSASPTTLREESIPVPRLCRACIEAYADRRPEGVCADCAPVMGVGV